MTAIYAVWTGDSFSYFPTKGEAVRYAKTVADEAELGDVIDVSRNEVGLTGRALLCAALNGTGFVDRRETVASFRGKGKGGAQ